MMSDMSNRVFPLIGRFQWETPPYICESDDGLSIFWLELCRVWVLARVRVISMSYCFIPTWISFSILKTPPANTSWLTKERFQRLCRNNQDGFESWIRTLTLPELYRYQGASHCCRFLWSLSGGEESNYPLVSQLSSQHNITISDPASDPGS